MIRKKNGFGAGLYFCLVCVVIILFVFADFGGVLGCYALFF